MTLRNRLITRATEAALTARDVATERVEGFRGLRALMTRTPDANPRFEAFLIGLVGAVRDDQLPEDRTDKDVEKTARRRRRRLGAFTFVTGPLVGATNQLVDLYCDTATVCDLAAVRGYVLGDAEIAAHMLVLWSVAADVDEATAALARRDGGGVSALVAQRLSGHAQTYLPGRWTTVGLIKATWKARGLLGDVRERMTTGPVKTVLAPGRSTRALIDRAERQLATTRTALGAPPMGAGQRLRSARSVAGCLDTLEVVIDAFRSRAYVHLPVFDVAGAEWTGPGAAPDQVVSFDDVQGELVVVALWTVEGGTRIGLFPLGGDDRGLSALLLVARWRRYDASLTPDGVMPGGQLTLRSPAVPEGFVAETLRLGELPHTPRNVELVGTKLTEMVLLKAMQLIASGDEAAATRFAEAHADRAGSFEAHMQTILDDLGAWNAGVLPYVQGVATRCRAILLDALASDPQTLPVQR